MKTITAVLLLILSIGVLGAADLESYQFIDRLLSLGSPGVPVIYEDTVIFTAPSSYRRVGISFAFEGYSKVYWFQNLKVHEDPAVVAAAGKKGADPYKDSGILFHVQTIPAGTNNIDYRMIIDGLWTADPLNPLTVSSAGGLTQSRVPVPPQPAAPSVFDAPPGSLSFTYKAPSGETVTVAGSFNGWDPFMYEMKETGPGVYTLTLPLPPGTYQYSFFHRGERVTDPYNPYKVYAKNGIAVSEATVR
jgi:hypothetical protein